MSTTTGIEWTDSTWNPIRGCSRVSEGCRNCYAERVAYRFSGAGQPYEGLAQLVNGHAAWTGKVDLVEKHLLDPLKWKPIPAAGHMDSDAGWVKEFAGRPRRIFVNSMSDLFHPNVPEEWIDRIFAVMALCPQHTFQVLTKRPERMLGYFLPKQYQQANGRNQMRLYHISRAVSEIAKLDPRAANAEPQTQSMLSNGGAIQNVHLGVSVEDQKTADERIPLLLQTPAAVRFISAEPLLGEIDLWQEGDGPLAGGHPTEADIHGERGMHFLRHGTSRLDWVICGGESGPRARPMHPDWARSLRDQCVDAGVPFFFKQWGEWAPTQVKGKRTLVMPGVDWTKIPSRALKKPDCAFGNSGDLMLRIGKKAAGSLLDGREWKEFPR